ncbi:MAG: hypothetical protein R3F34_15765 [Planctomycetota bacterium]
MQNFALAALLLALGPHLPLPRAELLPSFDADEAAWLASDVVVVTEGDAIDGKVTVLETWRGTVETGARLEFPALAVYADESERTVQHWDLGAPDPGRVERVTGARMVLFLARGADGSLLLPDRYGREGEQSVVWIEDGDVFARRQFLNPGPNAPMRIGSSEADLRRLDTHVAGLRRGLDRVAGFDDPMERATLARALCRDERSYVRDRAYEILVGAGAAGVEVLEAMVLDARDLRDVSRTIEALSDAAGDAAAPTLTEVLEQERSFWSTIDLPEDWWSSPVPTPDAREQRVGRYMRLYAAVRAAELVGADAALPVVDAIESLWEERDGLADFENRQIPEACRAFLAGGGR